MLRLPPQNITPHAVTDNNHSALFTGRDKASGGRRGSTCELGRQIKGDLGEPNR